MIKTILSYFWTITKRVPSDYSGELEITLYRGKKVLDTKNANYSYGALQKIIKKGLDEIDLNDIQSVLILGMGAGNIIQSLRNDYTYQKKIDAVEIDKKIIKIAKNEFGILPNKDTNIINDDAHHFLEESTKQYDLIVVDIFIDTKVPEQFYTASFGNQLKQHLSKKGIVLFNLGMNIDKGDKAFGMVKYFKKNKFNTKVMEKVERFNTLLIAKAL